MLIVSETMCRVMWSTDYQTAKSKNIPTDEMKTTCYCEQGTRWDVVRFVIEERFGMVITDVTKFLRACDNKIKYRGADGGSCVVGYLASQYGCRPHDIYVLGDAVDVSTIDDIILVVREVNLHHPQTHHPILNFFVPPSLLHEMESRDREYYDTEYWNQVSSINKQRQKEIVPQIKCVVTHTTTEEQRVEEMHQIQLRRELHGILIGQPPANMSRPEPDPRIAQKRKLPHPSAALLPQRYAGFVSKLGKQLRFEDMPKEKPGPGYVCRVCLGYFGREHFFGDCPAQSRPAWKPMDKRVMPHGLLMRTLTEIPWDSPVELVEAAPYLTFPDQRLLMPTEQYDALIKPPRPGLVLTTNARMVAVVPARDRWMQVEVLGPELLRRGIDRVLVCEQGPDHAFNRGLIKNLGFLYAKLNPNDTVYFHDADLLPTGSTRYTPVAANTVVHMYGHEHCLGGVIGMQASTFEHIGGFCNDQWKWGGEDRGLQTAVERNPHLCIDRSKFVPRFSDDEAYMEMDEMGSPIRGREAKRAFDRSFVERQRVVPKRTVFIPGLFEAKKYVRLVQRETTETPNMNRVLVHLLVP